MMIRILNKKLLLILCGLAILINYTNCGEVITPGLEIRKPASDLLDGMSVLSTNHPGQVDKVSTTQKALVGNRYYIEKVLLEVFTSTTYVIDVKGVLKTWVKDKVSVLGGPCNLYSSYTGVDCGGDISNSQSPLQADPGILRDSYRIRACEGLLSSDSGVRAAIEKVPSAMTTIDETTVRGAFDLFYRGEDPSAEAVQSLLELDKVLVTNKENITVRWRLILLQICESPGWQML